MIVSSQLLHQIADPTFPKNERARLRCQLAKQLEDVGNYETAREAMGELWPRVGERPVLDELDEATAAEVLLRVGALTGWLGSTRQIEGAQETAKNLISESITRFEALREEKKAAEAQMELGPCYCAKGLSMRRASCYRRHEIGSPIKMSNSRPSLCYAAQQLKS